MAGAHDATQERVALFVKEAGVLKGLMVMAQITGKVRRRDLIEQCLALAELEAQYLYDLRLVHQQDIAHV